VVLIRVGRQRKRSLAEQVVELFDELAASRPEGPWLTVASFVNRVCCTIR
jgi:hypothetical protein